MSNKKQDHIVDVNKKVTAVDKLHSRILFNIGLDDNDIKELARLASECMNYEKEQIVKSFDVGLDLGDARNYTGIKYYKETYETSN